VRALASLPVETVLDGELVAVNGDGQPSFSSLQNFGDGAAAILFYAFDAPVLAGGDLRSKPFMLRSPDIARRFPWGRPRPSVNTLSAEVDRRNR
jgi:hypothetical protein